MNDQKKYAREEMSYLETLLSVHAKLNNFKETCSSYFTMEGRDALHTFIENEMSRIIRKKSYDPGKD